MPNSIPTAEVIRSALLLGHGFAHGFATRRGGVSAPPFDSLDFARPRPSGAGPVGDSTGAVAENHRRLAAVVGYDPERLYETSQVHGSTTYEVRSSSAVLEVRALEADALIAREPGVAVGVRTADCVPVLIGDLESGAVAAVHVGWRGLVGRVIDRALATLAGEPGALRVAIGPHIRAASFEVGPEVAEPIARASSPAAIRPGEPRPFADLSRAIRVQLEGAGLGPDQIDDVGGDTYAEPGRFYSHRRDGDRAGRHLSVICPRLPRGARG